MNNSNSSIDCAHIERTEDLALGNLTAIVEAEARAHLDACDTCSLAHAMFAEERALFVAHREFHAEDDAATALPFLDLDRVRVEAAESKPKTTAEILDGRSRFARVLPAMLAVAAGIFGLVNLGDLQHGASASHVERMRVAPMAVVAQSSSGVAPEIHVTTTDETLACSYPQTASAASRTLKDDRNASLVSSSAIAINMTEDPTNACMNIERVTSSASTP